MVDIDNRALFFEKLETGINLFLGAGFSVLGSPQGYKLPVASELCEEICKAFTINKAYSNDLEKLSSILKRNNKKQFQDYLRARYHVEAYHPLYDVIEHLNLASIITTNIDNLIFAIMEKSLRYYVSSVPYYGAIKKDGHAIEYIPLHGDILDIESELYFGKFELCNVDNRNHGLFRMMERALLRKPTLFWGYGFHDGSVSGVIDRVLESGEQEIWIQLLPEDENIQFFRDLGCHVIIGDTESLLKEIALGLQKKEGLRISAKEDDFWKKYAMPELSQMESLPTRDFYEQGKTNWYYALTKKAYLTKNVETIVTLAQKHKNIIVVGIPLSGKTMTLMQVACKLGQPTFFIDNLNEAEARLICNNAIQDKHEYIILVDNCSEDMRAYKLLAECENIRTIATSEIFLYEASKHLLEEVAFKKLDICEIDYEEAKSFVSHIPSSLRGEKVRYEQNKRGQYSILELIHANVKKAISKNKVLEALKKVKAQNTEAFETILLITYLVYHKSILTTDILMNYFSTVEPDLIKGKIKVAQSYLEKMNATLTQDANDETHYALSSSIFSRYNHEVALSNFKADYGRVIKKFVHKVPSCYIYRNNVFRKMAYNAELFFDIFSDDGDSVYEKIYRDRSTIDVFQQWALYKVKTRRFFEALAVIDKAIERYPHDFGLKHTRATILFEGNQDKSTPEAKGYLEEAMAILERCYQNDKQKVYHAQKYAKCALLFEERYDTTYIEQAFLWLRDLMTQKDMLSWQIEDLYKKLSRIREKQNK